MTVSKTDAEKCVSLCMSAFTIIESIDHFIERDNTKADFLDMAFTATYDYLKIVYHELEAIRDALSVAEKE
ncbi:MAG TPA: hypothetical protein VEG44_04445 [Candidatus Acidoferrales bacterium]|nr:hypothetical protein [Candidatus Acidoferrales bacterium]